MEAAAQASGPEAFNLERTPPTRQAPEIARASQSAQETVEAPLNALADADLVHGSAALAAFNASLR